MITDVELRALVAERRLLLRQLSEVMARVGSSNSHRATINAERARQRKEYRRAIRRTEAAIAARCALLIPRSGDDT